VSIKGSPSFGTVSGNFVGDGYQIRSCILVDEVRRCTASITYFSDDVQPLALKQARDCNSQGFGRSYLYCTVLLLH
jgi:hypothetical protein